MAYDSRHADIDDDEQNDKCELSYLPPGVEDCQDAVHGMLALTVKQLLWINIKISYDNVRIKPVFWGQTGGHSDMKLRVANSGAEVNRTVKRKVEYGIR